MVRCGLRRWSSSGNLRTAKIRKSQTISPAIERAVESATREWIFFKKTRRQFSFAVTFFTTITSVAVILARRPDLMCKVLLGKRETILITRTSSHCTHLWRRPHTAHLVPEHVWHPSRGGRGHARNLRLSIQIYIRKVSVHFSNALKREQATHPSSGAYLKFSP